ncbi:hypothetical protein CIK05_05500 [Bdellovibrio sp. qaytius]|nr:hypothetical protein CIK05_05500 [Bdellovibrio sp. qaytius]
MKKLIFSLITLTAAFALATAAPAETTDLIVEGVHCTGCTKMISKKVCADPKLSESFESCGVTVVDAKKQIGKISLRLKEGKTLDTVAIAAAVKTAGDNYTLQAPAAKPEVKK